MKKVLKTLALAGFMLALIGCNNVYENQTLDKEAAKTSEQIAETYVRNLFTWMELDESSSVPYEFIYSCFEVDPYDLTEEEKTEYQESWVKYYVESLTEKLEENTEFKNSIILENSAFEMAKASTPRSAYATDLPDAYNKYIKSLFNTQNNDEANRSSSVTIDGTEEKNMIPIDGKINEKTKVIFKSYQKEGRILLNFGKEGSSISVGHASLMLASGITGIGGYSTEMDTITAFPFGGKVTWNNKHNHTVDGVQYEPLEYWAGTAEAKAARNVYVLDVYNNIPGIKTTAKQGKKVITYSEGKIGCPYHLANTYIPTTFYCTSLVRHAWNSAGVCLLALPPNGVIILPSDIYASILTKKVAEWSNY